VQLLSKRGRKDWRCEDRVARIACVAGTRVGEFVRVNEEVEAGQVVRTVLGGGGAAR
jgi:hypothetical protein